MSKKSAKNTKEFRQYSVGDHVLGKVRGFPPWPGMVSWSRRAFLIFANLDSWVLPGLFELTCNTFSVLDCWPCECASGRGEWTATGEKINFPLCTLFPDGRLVCVYSVLCTWLILYFSAWLHPKDISSLKRHEVETFLADEGKKRSADLKEGYRIALDPNDWLSNNEKSRQALLEAQEQVDELASESEGVGDARKGKGRKKRKRDSDEELSREKKTTKSKKDPTESKKKISGSKSRKNGKSKSVVESEDDGDNAQAEGVDAGPSKNALSPPSKKAKRDKDEEVDDCEQLLRPCFHTWHLCLFSSLRFP